MERKRAYNSLVCSDYESSSHAAADDPIIKERSISQPKDLLYPDDICSHSRSRQACFPCYLAVFHPAIGPQEIENELSLVRQGVFHWILHYSVFYKLCPEKTGDFPALRTKDFLNNCYIKVLKWLRNA